MKKTLLGLILISTIIVVIFDPNVASSQTLTTRSTLDLGSTKSYPVPYGTVLDSSHAAAYTGDFPSPPNLVTSEPGVFPMHRDLTGGGMTTANNLSNNDVLVKLKVNDQDFVTSPSWYDKTATWWIKGFISDDELLQGTQYLVSNGIIKTSTVSTTDKISNQPLSEPSSSNTVPVMVIDLPLGEPPSTKVNIQPDLTVYNDVDNSAGGSTTSSQFSFNLSTDPSIPSLNSTFGFKDSIAGNDFSKGYAIISNLPVGTKYTITENPIPGYVTTYENHCSGSIEEVKNWNDDWCHIVNRYSPTPQELEREKIMNQPLGEPTPDEIEREKIMNMPLGGPANNESHIAITGPSQLTTTNTHLILNGAADSNSVNFVTVFMDGKPVSGNLFSFDFKNETWTFPFDYWKGTFAFPLGTHVLTAQATLKGNGTTIMSNSQTITLILPPPVITSVTDGTANCNPCAYINGTKDSETNEIAVYATDEKGGNQISAGIVHFDGPTKWSAVFAFPYNLDEGKYTIYAKSGLIGDGIGGRMSNMTSNTVTLNVQARSN